VDDHSCRYGRLHSPHRGLAAIAAVHGDIAEQVGRKTGLSGTLNGDHLVTINPEDTCGEEARFVVECKDRRLSMTKTLEELAKAMQHARSPVAASSLGSPAHAVLRAGPATGKGC
jgi:hypothetical protein